MSGGDTSPNDAATPPPPRQPSPFGRFIQQPVLLIGLVALMVSLPVIALSVGGGGGGGAASPPDGQAIAPTTEDKILGSWSGTLRRRAGAQVEVALTIRWTGHEPAGKLMRGATCRGSLRHDSTMGRSVAFSYRGRASRDRCPRRSTIILSVVSDDRLRIDELRGRRLVAQGSVRAR